MGSGLGATPMAISVNGVSVLVKEGKFINPFHSDS